MVDHLSRREQRILQWLSEGLRDKDIGPLLGLTTRSVTRIVCEICDKLDARTRTHAACMFLFELDPSDSVRGCETFADLVQNPLPRNGVDGH